MAWSPSVVPPIRYRTDALTALLAQHGVPQKPQPGATAADVADFGPLSDNWLRGAQPQGAQPPQPNPIAAAPNRLAAIQALVALLRAKGLGIAHTPHIS